MDQPTGLEASSLLVIHLVVLQNWFDDCFRFLTREPWLPHCVNHMRAISSCSPVWALAEWLQQRLINERIHDVPSCISPDLILVCESVQR